MSFVDKFNNILQNDEKVVDITCANKKNYIM